MNKPVRPLAKSPRQSRALHALSAQADDVPRSPNRITEVLNALRERISKHEVAPGANLREQEIAEEFDVPRTLVREVFSALEQRGLIQRIPNHGAVVARMDISQLFQIYDIREVLEGLCVRLATQNTQPESWQDLLEFFEGSMSEYLKSGDIDSYLAGYDSFRKRTLEAAANSALSEIMDGFWDKTRVLVARIVILPGRAQDGLAEHCKVLRAMRSGDAVLAEILRRESMKNAKAALIKFQKYVV